MLRKLFLLCLVSSSLWLVTGCGGGEEPAGPAAGTTENSNDPLAAKSPPGQTAVDGAGMPTEDAPPPSDDDDALASNTKTSPPKTTTPVQISDEPAETPDAAMLAMMQGIRNQQLEAAWNFMPPSYREDINMVVQTFAEKMDPELWERTFEVLNHLVTALESKKELILSDPNLENAPLDAEQREKGFDAIIALLRTITKSELSNLEQLKEFNGGEFMAGTGSSVMKQVLEMAQMMPGNPVQTEFLEKLDQATATVVTSEGDTATVRLEAPGEEPEEMEMVRVEGYWIPAEFSQQFPSALATAQAQVEDITPEMIEAQKPQVMGILATVDQLASNIEAAETQEELAQTMQQALAPIMMMAMGGGMAGGPGIDSAPTDLVTVMVRGKIDDDTAAKIEEALVNAADDPDAAKDSIETLRVDELLSVDVAPVSDIEAFAQQIKFGKVLDVDTDAKIITVEIGGDDSDSDTPKEEGDATEESSDDN